MAVDFKNNKLSELIEGQLPSFLQEEGPKFIKFIEKYYEWLETSKLEVSVNGELNLDFKKYSYDILAKRSVEGQTVKHVYANLLNSYQLENGNYVFYIKEYNENPKLDQTKGFLSGDSISFIKVVKVDEDAEDFEFDGNISVVSYAQNVTLSSKNIWNVQDVDRTLDDYVDFFMKEFLEGFPLSFPSELQSSDIDVPEFKKFLVKHSREFYQSKGTEDSFKYFFRTIFNSESEISYPKEQILKPSDNTYLKTKIIQIIPNDIDFSTIVSQRIVGVNSGVSAYVESVFKTNKGKYEILEITLNEYGILGDFREGESITLFDDSSFIIGRVYHGASEIFLRDVQESFNLNESFYIDRTGNVIDYNNISNSDRGSLIELKVDEIKSGKITEIQIINGGEGYNVGDKITFDNTDCLQLVGPKRSIEAIVSKIGDSGNILEIHVHCDGKGYIKYPTITKIGDKEITIESFKLIGKDVGTIKTLNIRNSGINYSGVDYYDVDLNSSGTVNVRVYLGSIFDRTGCFLNNNSFVSDTKYIQDSLYYQTYSYLIKSSIQVKEFRDLLKRLIHPAGMEMFGEISVKKYANVEMKAKIKNVVSIILRDYIGLYSDVLIRDFDYLYDLEIIDGNSSDTNNIVIDLDLSGSTKDYIIGETVKSSNLAEATVVSWDSGNETLTLSGVSVGEFQRGEIIIGSESDSTSTIVVVYDTIDGGDWSVTLPDMYYHGSYASDYLYNENTHQNYRYKIKYKNLTAGTRDDNYHYKWEPVLFNLEPVTASIDEQSTTISIANGIEQFNIKDLVSLGDQLFVVTEILSDDNELKVNVCSDKGVSTENILKRVN